MGAGEGLGESRSVTRLLKVHCRPLVLHMEPELVGDAFSNGPFLIMCRYNKKYWQQRGFWELLFNILPNGGRIENNKKKKKKVTASQQMLQKKKKGLSAVR